jgi:two-component system OmpR family response regulator/two-component system response regulator RstA
VGSSQENTKPHVMVVEDDASLADWVGDYLLDNGYDISLSDRGDEAINLIRIDDPDIVILDINLPVKSGFEVCREVRAFYHKPILMLTARGEESDEVTGIECGANDYLIKPVRPKALLARVNALLQRNETVPAAAHIREFGSFRIDAESRSVYLEEQSIDLSSHEFNLLSLLTEHAGEVMSRDEIVSNMRGIEYDGFNRSVDILISRLRKKLHDDSSKPKKIKTVWGKGYMFATDAW